MADERVFKTIHSSELKAENCGKNPISKREAAHKKAFSSFSKNHFLFGWKSTFVLNKSPQTRLEFTNLTGLTD